MSTSAANPVRRRERDPAHDHAAHRVAEEAEIARGRGASATASDVGGEAVERVGAGSSGSSLSP